GVPRPRGFDPEDGPRQRFPGNRDGFAFGFGADADRFTRPTGAVIVDDRGDQPGPRVRSDESSGLAARSFDRGERDPRRVAVVAEELLFFAQHRFFAERRFGWHHRVKGAARVAHDQRLGWLFAHRAELDDGDHTTGGGGAPSARGQGEAL